MRWLALMLGGGIGASLRYALTVLVDQRVPALFPWGTLACNVGGCLVIGVVITTFDSRGYFSPALRLFAVTGLLGAFTTFSTFSLETWKLFEAGRTSLALANVAGNLLACLLATFIGIALVRNLG